MPGRLAIVAAVRAVRAIVERERPSWTFKAISPTRGVDAYREEVRTIARARVLVSLFGSSLHNARFMPNGSILVELHGALKQNWAWQNDHFYRDLCESELGVQWVGYAVPDFRPPVDRPWGDSYNTAHIPLPAFVRFFERVLRGELRELNEEYEEQMRANPGPNRSTPFWING